MSFVWITFINYGYLPFCKNFLLSMKKANVPFTLHVYCCKDCMYELKGFDNCICIDSSLFIKEISSSLETWGKKEYIRLTFYKLDAIAYTLKHSNYNYVGYIDTDIVLFSDPTPIILTIFNDSRIKVVAQCDEQDRCFNRYRCQNICSGVIAFKKDTSIYPIFHYKESDFDKYSGDQTFLLNKLKEYNVPAVTVDKRIFMHGDSIKKGWPTTGCCLIHFNWMVGTEKIDYMKKLNCWYLSILTNTYFQCANKDNYPPFKTGLYLEEYIYKNIKKTKRTYIPIKWTNFQIASWFPSKKNEMQILFNEWVRENPSDSYFTVVQHDDGCMLNLPPNTIVYGACNGDVPIPLIYEETTFALYPKKTFHEKVILCSFVGNKTHPVREKLFALKKFHMIDSGGWKPTVNKTLQDLFIHTTIDSKFALAPRGYGRSSFRFFECFKLGTVPVYVWDDIEWLPFKHKIDYSKLCVSIHIGDIDNLDSILSSITEQEYNSMLSYYETIRYLFELEGMCHEIENMNQ